MRPEMFAAIQRLVPLVSDWLDENPDYLTTRPGDVRGTDHTKETGDE